MENKIPIMTEEQLEQARVLIDNHCAALVDGNCILLDDGEACCCVQKQSYSLICIHFHDNVLPLRKGLHRAIYKGSPQKRCAICQKPIFPASNRTKYCKECAKEVRRTKEKERLAKHYTAHAFKG